ncbi:TfoX/Sxy family protein [Enterococcus sp. LJL99]
MGELMSLPNIGKEMVRKLKSVGITTTEELKEIGSKNAFFKLKMNYSNSCLVHLYCLQGAIDLVDYTALTPEMKEELKQFSDSLKELE